MSAWWQPLGFVGPKVICSAQKTEAVFSPDSPMGLECVFRGTDPRVYESERVFILSALGRGCEVTGGLVRLS